MKLFLIGGFLGSGKTTAIQRASAELLKKGIKPAAILNDQGVQLVDREFLQKVDMPVGEVTGGCFCCNYDTLEQNIEQFINEDEPDVIFAEPVGSCTDLVSTVINPTVKFHDREVVLSVFADARILPVLVNSSSYFFDEEVHYIYNKQLEEADLLIINKIDLLNDRERSDLEEIIRNRYPSKKVIYQNSLEPADIRKWLDILYVYKTDQPRKSVEIDYDIYAQGEAKLGWLDCRLIINSSEGSAAEICEQFIHNFSYALAQKELSIGHLKYFIDAGKHHQKISITQRQHLSPITIDGEKDSIRLLINARVQVEPEKLHKILIQTVNELITEEDNDIIIDEISAFKPGYPMPTHKISSVL